MALAPGTRLGPYEITAQIGAGGMGEVYRARDTKLNRDVALKILPEAFVADSERVARFRREAQVLASLNHPNIAAIYGFEDSGSTHALVLELVDGATLADRIAHGPIPLDEALPIAKQVVEALESAHDRGIVHRDLKPANVKVREDGTLKVLDFGLAKMLEFEGAPSTALAALTHSPTLTSPAMTMAGVILGTAAYMSPEQARGKPVDKRADIWAFGVILFEMLTGRRLFDGHTTSDTLAAILKEEPEWTLVPPQVQPLLRACLQRDAARRLRDIGDVRLLIDRGVVGAAPFARAGGTRRWVAGSVLAVAIAAMATVATAFYLRRPPTDAQVIRFEIPTTSPVVTALAISPDGTRLAYIATDNNGAAIWSRSLNGLTPQRLEGTENATQLFWSADSRALGFFADGKLKRIDIGGRTVSLADAGGDGISGAWNKNGVILFSSAEGVSVKIFRVSTQGGEPVPLQPQNTRPGEQPLAIQGPFLPDGIHFLAIGFEAIPRPEAVLNIGTLGSSTITRVMSLGQPSTTNLPWIGYAPPGDLLFTRSGTLMAQAFDVKRLELVGDPVPIAERVGLFSVSQNGILVFRTAPNLPTGTSELVWLDRGGQRVGQIGSASTYNNPRLSRDGRRVAYDSTSSGGIASGNSNIWTMDTSQGVPVRLTFNPRSDIVPSWSPDGTRIAFGSAGDPQGGINYSVFRRAASGAGADEPLFAASPNEIGVPQDWSSDGRYIVFMRSPAATTNVALNYWVLPLDGDRKPFPLVLSKSRNVQPRVSPDSKWIAFATNESGPYQIVVQPFPDSSKGKWQITSRGGVEPTWRADGRELYYIALDGKVMAVPVRTTDSSFDVGAPVALFPSPIDVPRVPTALLYDVTGDGQRFLFNVPVSSRNASPAPTPMTVVLNWTSGMGKE